MKVYKVLFGRAVSLENLFSVWAVFQKGKQGKPDVQAFEFNLERNIFQLAEELFAGVYHHGPYHTFRICDPKPRAISKAAVRDRLVHHLVFKILYRIFDSTFIYHSYSSRLGRGTHLAVTNLSLACRSLSHNYTRPIYALKCDIKKFFASIPHQKLLNIIQNKIKDTRFVGLTKEIVYSFSSNLNSTFEATGGGVRRQFV